MTLRRPLAVRSRGLECRCFMRRNSSAPEDRFLIENDIDTRVTICCTNYAKCFCIIVTVSLTIPLVSISGSFKSIYPSNLSD